MSSSNNILIHSANPKSRSVEIVVFALVVRPSIPTFQNLAKQNKAKTIFANGETVGGRVDHWRHLSFCYFCLFVVYQIIDRKSYFFSHIVERISDRKPFYESNEIPTGVINDPFGQTHGSEQYFHLKFVLCC